MNTDGGSGRRGVEPSTNLKQYTNSNPNGLLWSVATGEHQVRHDITAMIYRAVILTKFDANTGNHEDCSSTSVEATSAAVWKGRPWRRSTCSPPWPLPSSPPPSNPSSFSSASSSSAAMTPEAGLPPPPPRGSTRAASGTPVGAQRRTPSSTPCATRSSISTACRSRTTSPPTKRDASSPPLAPCESLISTVPQRNSSSFLVKIAPFMLWNQRGSISAVENLQFIVALQKTEGFHVKNLSLLECLVADSLPCSCFLVKASLDNPQERGVRAEPTKHLLLLQFCRTGTRWRAQNVHCWGEISVCIHFDWVIWVMVNYLHCYNILVLVSGHKHTLGREGDVYLPTGIWSCSEALACQPLHGMTSLNKNQWSSQKECAFCIEISDSVFKSVYGKTDTSAAESLLCSIHLLEGAYYKFFCALYSPPHILSGFLFCWHEL